MGDLTGITLGYLRSNAEIEVRVNDVDMKNAAAVLAMRVRGPGVTASAETGAPFGCDISFMKAHPAMQTMAAR